ncbi:MAG: hypothetical protein ACOZB3_05670 [Calditrichota bacterium]
MKKLSILIALAALLTTAVFMGGCGLVSGTVFISQEVDGSLEAQAGAASMLAERGTPTLDDQFGGAKVDLTTNSEWQDIDIDGIEDICVRLTAHNLLSQEVSGEVWVTVGDVEYTTIQQVQANGFRVFAGLALAPNETRTFECSETLELFENLDQLVDAVANGVFWVWARGDQSTYHITYDAIYLGMHVTGSI